MHAAVRAYSGKGAKGLIDVSKLGTARPTVSEGTVVFQLR